MKTIVVLNATKVNKFAFLPFCENKSAFEFAFDAALVLAKSKNNILVLADSAVRGLISEKNIDSLCTVYREDWNIIEFFNQISCFAQNSDDVENIILVSADSPFIDSSLGQNLLLVHKKYRAEYTFADGYPLGFAPEILSFSVLSRLIFLAEKHNLPLERDFLFTLIQKDINSFDIETELSKVDLRTYRLSTVCDSKRNLITCKNLYNLGCRTSSDACKIIPKHYELLRSLPAFLWVEIASACPSKCSYCPYPLFDNKNYLNKGFMDVAKFDSLMADAESFCDDLVVDISLWGEVSLHPQIDKIVECVMRRKNFKLIMETSGLGWKPGCAESLAQKYGNRLYWIVGLDDSSIDGYLALRGQGYLEATMFAEKMIAVSKQTLYVQAVRMIDNEERLETFYRNWKTKTDNVIIQKYDSFCSVLPNKLVSDLSPLERLPCRHLARDMAVLINGDVPMCKHSFINTIDNKIDYYKIVGNVFSDGIDKVWNNINKEFELHIEGNYHSVCGKCDEYHTYNA